MRTVEKEAEIAIGQHNQARLPMGEPMHWMENRKLAWF
jgi:hypothetical protein